MFRSLRWIKKVNFVESYWVNTRKTNREHDVMTPDVKWNGYSYEETYFSLTERWTLNLGGQEEWKWQ